MLKASAPNEVWTVDFKGWWLAGDNERCEPLTVRDAYSRFLLAVEVLPGTKLLETRRVFERVFREYGLPKAIQSDNGTPFINTAARGGLTRLSAWWVSLGIKVVRSRPGCPQDNGGHERMHGDLRADVQSSPAVSREAEQRACSRWRQEFNHVRPHEALNGKTPAECYRRSEIRRTKPLPYSYPGGWIVRTASQWGIISIDDEKYGTSRALAGQVVALEPLRGLSYRLWFRNLDLGEMELVAPREVIDGAVAAFIKKPFSRVRPRRRHAHRRARARPSHA